MLDYDVILGMLLMTLLAVIIRVGMICARIALIDARLRASGPAQPPTESAHPDAPPESGPAVHATLRRNADGEWECDGKWVREGTEAWQQVHDTPGRALRDPNGFVVEGRQ